MTSKTAHIGNKKERSEDIKIDEDVTFEKLNFSDLVLKGLHKAGYVKPSPIQLRAIPVGRCGQDIIVQAKSGTGKTLVFASIALESVVVSSTVAQVLVLAPTREIAFQNAHVIFTVGSEMEGLKVQVFIGGLSLENDQEKCKSCHIAVGTPGRVRQLMENESLKYSTIRLLVLDEADRLMEESFFNDIMWIFSKLPPSRQVIAASATFEKNLAALLYKFMQNPSYIKIDHGQPTLLAIKQFVYSVSYHPMMQQQVKNKLDVLLKLLKITPFTQCIIFTNFQTRAESLGAQLSGHGYASLSISGSQNQTKRLQTILKLRQFQCKILVATDLAARGIDAEHIDLVVHFDVANDPATHLHRVGRAGRYGAAGLSINIACEGNELTELRSIITKTKSSIGILPVELLSNSSESNVIKCHNSPLFADYFYKLWDDLQLLEGTGFSEENAEDTATRMVGIGQERDINRELMGLKGKSKQKKTSQAKKNKQKMTASRSQNYVEPLVGELEQLNIKVNEGVQDREVADKIQRVPNGYNTTETKICNVREKNHLYYIWNDYISVNKVYIQQTEYLKMMNSFM